MVQKVIYEDKEIVALIEDNAAAIGHVIITSKKPIPNALLVPDEIMGKMFIVSNKISTILFESLNIQGTNMIIQTGIPAGQKKPQFSINIIPRNQNDGINFKWAPKQLNDEEKSIVELQLIEACKSVGVKKTSKTETVKVATTEEIKEDKDKENYLLRQLDRIP